MGLRNWIAGVVDEDVDGDALGVEMLERGANRRFVGDVEGARLTHGQPRPRRTWRPSRQLLSRRAR